MVRSTVNETGRPVARCRPASPSVGDGFTVRAADDCAWRLGGLISSQPMPNAGGVPEFLRWGHGEALSGSEWVSLFALGQNRAEQRLWRSITRLLAGCGFGRNGPQRQGHTTSLT